jgi:hypothetical protein
VPCLLCRTVYIHACRLGMNLTALFPTVVLWCLLGYSQQHKASDLRARGCSQAALVCEVRPVLWEQRIDINLAGHVACGSLTQWGGLNKLAQLGCHLQNHRCNCYFVRLQLTSTLPVMLPVDPSLSGAASISLRCSGVTCITR